MCLCVRSHGWQKTVHTHSRRQMRCNMFHSVKTNKALVQSELLVSALPCPKCVKMNVSHVNKWCRQCLVTSGDTVRDCNSTFPMPRGFFRTRNQPTVRRRSRGLLTTISILLSVCLWFHRFSLISIFYFKTIIRGKLVNTAAVPPSHDFHITVSVFFSSVSVTK